MFYSYYYNININININFNFKLIIFQVENYKTNKGEKFAKAKECIMENLVIITNIFLNLKDFKIKIFKYFNEI